MANRRYTTMEILQKLREADDLRAQGQTVAQVTRHLGVTQRTYFRWCKSHAELRELEAEIARLKKLVAELTVDKIILRAVAGEKL